jgi:hypothetical protein
VYQYRQQISDGIMYREIPGDIFTYKLKENTCVPHVVNNVGVAGSGLTMPIMKRWPDSRKQYEEWEAYSYRFQEDPSYQLGQVWFCGPYEGHVVAHMLAQRAPGGYSVDGIYLRPLMIEALVECMLRVRKYCKEKNLVIVTGQFGGKRAGGDFEKEIKPMILDIWRDLDVTILTYEE